MGYFSFLPDVNLYSAQFNSDVRQQLIITCDSANRPTSSLIAGMRIHETDTNRVYIYNGSAWVLHNEPGMCDAWKTYTGTVSGWAGGMDIGNGSLVSKYRKVGKTFDVIIQFVAGSTTTFGPSPSFWLFSVPFAMDQVITTTMGLASCAASLFPIYIESVTYSGINYAIPDSVVSNSDCSVNYVHSTRPATWVAGNWIYMHFKATEL